MLSSLDEQEMRKTNYFDYFDYFLVAVAVAVAVVDVVVALSLFYNFQRLTLHTKMVKENLCCCLA